MAGNENVIESLKLEIGVEIKGHDQIQPFIEQLNSLSTALTDINTKLADYASTVSRIGSLSFPAITVPSVNTPEVATQAVPSLPALPDLSEYASDLSEAIEPTRELAQDTGELVQQIQSTIQPTQKSSDTLKKHGKEAKKSGEETKKVGSKLKEFANSAKKAAQEVAKFAAALAKGIPRAFAASLGAVASGIKAAGHAAKNAIGHFTGLFNSFVRIVKYRAIRAVLRQITEGFTTGVQNLAIYSDKFNETMSTFVTYTLYLKNALGTLAKPLIEVAVPIIKQIIELIVKAINKINEFIAALRGQKTYTVAKVYWQDYASTIEDSSDKAEKGAKKAKKSAKETAKAVEEVADAAEEAKKSLLGFDELNILQDNSLADKIKDNLGVDDIDDIADIPTEEEEINNYDRTQMFEEKAVTAEMEGIAKRVLEIIAKLKEKFAEAKADFLDFVERVKSYIPVEAIEDFKKAWERLKKTVEEFFNSSAAESMKDFFAWLVGLSITALINQATDLMNAISSILKFIQDPSWDNFSQMIDDIVDAIFSIPDTLISGLEDKLGENNPVVRTLRNALETVKSTVKLIAKAVGALFSGDPEAWEDVKFEWQGVKVHFSDFIANIFGYENMDEMSTEVADAWWTIKEWIVSPFRNFGKDIAASWDVSMGDFKTTWEQTKKDFEDGWTNFWSKFDTFFENLGNSLDDTNEKIATFWKDLKLLGEAIGKGIKSFINDKILAGIEWLVNKALGGLGKLLEKAKELIDKLPESVKEKLHLDAISNLTIKEIKIPRWQTGGFPEDGLFYANHKELVGSFSNGRTAVANNEQIEEGIEEAAYRGFMRAMSNSSGNGSYTFIAQLNGKTIFEEVVKQNKSATKAYGANPMTAF